MRHPPTPHPREDDAPARPAWTALLPGQPSPIDEATTEVPVVTLTSGQVTDTSAEAHSAEVAVETEQVAPESARQNAEVTRAPEDPLAGATDSIAGIVEGRVPAPAEATSAVLEALMAGTPEVDTPQPEAETDDSEPADAEPVVDAAAADSDTAGPTAEQPDATVPDATVPDGEASAGAEAGVPDVPPAGAVYPLPGTPMVPALRPGDVTQPPIAIWPSDQAQRIRDRWRDLQVLFIDEPDEAVAGARSLVTDAVRTLSERLLAEQDEFDPRRDNDRPDTEALRVAMRRYREFLDRLLAL